MESKLLEAMSMSDLEELKAKYPALSDTIDTAINANKAKADAEAIVTRFTAGIAKLVDKLPAPPDTVYNVRLVWHKDETSGEYSWIAEPNHVCYPHGSKAKSSNGNGGGTLKRAISVYKREGMALNLIGHFKTGHACCVNLKLDDDGNSATRVLRDNGYLVEAYTGDGTNFTINPE
jgi:hypothetical protein